MLTLLWYLSVCVTRDTGPVHTWNVPESALLWEGLTSPPMMERASPSAGTVTTSSLRSVRISDDPQIFSVRARSMKVFYPHGLLYNNQKGVDMVIYIHYI